MMSCLPSPVSYLLVPVKQTSVTVLSLPLSLSWPSIMTTEGATESLSVASVRLRVERTRVSMRSGPGLRAASASDWFTICCSRFPPVGCGGAMTLYSRGGSSVGAPGGAPSGRWKPATGFTVMGPDTPSNTDRAFSLRFAGGVWLVWWSSADADRSPPRPCCPAAGAPGEVPTGSPAARPAPGDHSALEPSAALPWFRNWASSAGMMPDLCLRRVARRVSRGLVTALPPLPWVSSTWVCPPPWER
mmetsp:Transcript_13142/g.39770  ORF Transcript_13142/g.39770 Transcript_13142/m.39770 type:complete len:245 (+) Transcript_13142:2938-3672(+)